MTALLNHIKSPRDLKALSLSQLSELAQEIRSELIPIVTHNGGHIASNLGVVELTIALHYIFNSPEDAFVFDVSHQCYTHKFLTGRRNAFKTIRQTSGLSGFMCRAESLYDCYGGGHAGCALSAALGMAVARDRLGNNDQHVIAMIGDGSLTCGVTMEALNNVVSSTKRLIVILNDNKWSIGKNVGAIAKYLNEVIIHPVYNRLHDNLEAFLQKIPGGHSFMRMAGKAKTDAKDLFMPSSLFEKYGLRYIGPIDGHDFKTLLQYLEFCKNAQEPILLHVHTTKGKGLESATKNPEHFHGIGGLPVPAEKIDPATDVKSTGAMTYQDVFGNTLLKLAKKDKTIMAITAAMASGTGLSTFAEKLPAQFFDVGIAEEHAVVFAAGLATQGLKPFCAIYSTFLQRAMDMIQQDVCLQRLPVVFCIDRAGLSANDGPTHHGLLDIALIRCIPNAVILQPKDEDELADMLYSATLYGKPTFIRYPRGKGVGVPIKETPKFIPIGEAEILKEGSDIAIWALGPFVHDALKIATLVEQKTSLSVGVVNARFAKPLASALLISQAQKAKMIVTLEDHAVTGGFGTAVAELLMRATSDFERRVRCTADLDPAHVLQYARESRPCAPARHLEIGGSTPSPEEPNTEKGDCCLKSMAYLKCFGWPDTFIPHATSNYDLLGKFNLTPEAIAAEIIRI